MHCNISLSIYFAVIHFDIDKRSSICYFDFCSTEGTCCFGVSGRCFFALVAQSVEHHHGKVGVIGSNPIEGSVFLMRKDEWRSPPEESLIMASSKKKGPVEKIALQCSECKRKNYTTEKNRRNTPGKLELNKYCPFDQKHTLHRETKVK